jgi:hypothetical protein
MGTAPDGGESLGFPSFLPEKEMCELNVERTSSAAKNTSPQADVNKIICVE